MRSCLHLSLACKKQCGNKTCSQKTFPTLTSIQRPREANQTQECIKSNQKRVGLSRWYLGISLKLCLDRPWGFFRC